MPAFIKTQRDEQVWSRAKEQVRKQYPKLSEKDDNFWALTNSIYQNMNKGDKKSMKKSASGVVARVLAKKAYVPLSPAAQEAMQGAQQPPQGGAPAQDPAMMQGGQPPMDPAMAQQGGMPPMPLQEGDPAAMDPAMMQQGGQMPMPEQGGEPTPIPVISGPNGEPIDAETGFMVVDFAQQIEQDPMTGILLNKMTGEFMSPDGQPIPPDQAMQMLEQASAQAQGGMPPQGGEQPPMDPAMMQQGGGAPIPPQQGGAPVPPEGAEPMQQTASAEEDAMMAQQQQMMAAPPVQGQYNEAAGMQVDPNTGMPIDPSTGMLIDVATGNLIDPSTGQPVQAGAGVPAQDGDAMSAVSQLFEAVPGLQEFIANAPKQLEAQDKTLSRVMHDNSAVRTDLQGLRREVQKVNDNNDTLLTRLDNMLNIVEQIVTKQEMMLSQIAPQPKAPTPPMIG